MESTIVPWPQFGTLSEVIERIETETRFRAKVKPHGVSVAIIVSKLTDNESYVTMQDKHGNIFGEKSFEGRLWDLIRPLLGQLHKNRAILNQDVIVIYGKFCGNGIRKEYVDPSMLPRDHFFIYAVKLQVDAGKPFAAYEYDPIQITLLVTLYGPGIKVLPWETTISLKPKMQDNMENIKYINELMYRIEERDPHEYSSQPRTYDIFTANGTRKELAWYDVDNMYKVGTTSINFITVGAVHHIPGIRSRVDSAETVSMNEYIDALLSHDRYEQGLIESGVDGTDSMAYKFADWIVLDAASVADDRWGTFPDIARKIRNRAARWYLRTINDGVNVVLNALRRDIAKQR